MISRSRPRGRVMRHQLIVLTGIATALLAFGVQPVVAADTAVPAPKKRAAPARATAPTQARATPVQQQAPARTTSWTGVQAGGFGGGSPTANNFVEPGANQF